MKKMYMDYAATTPMDPEVIKVITPCFSEIYGNVSSLHSFGRKAKRAVEESRETVASFVGADSDEIVFTSGGTESNNYALKGVADANIDKGNHIIISSVEHHCVTETCKFLETRGLKVTYLPVDKYGVVDPEEVKKAITDKTILISIMHANNEIGTIEPIAEIGNVARDNEVYFHTDAVQTFGHLPINVGELNVDLLSASAHKLYGPKGVGMLYIRKGTKIKSFMHGGDQESGRRASTHNVPGIVGFGKAVELVKESMKNEAVIQIKWRDKLIKGIFDKIESSRLNGHPVKRLPNNVNVSVEYIEGESMVLDLDMEGVACSTGSACTSSTLEPSHVLLAIGLSPDVAHGSLRFTIGRFSKKEDINHILKVLPKVVEKLRAMSPLYNKEKK